MSKEIYATNKSAAKGAELTCPSCGTRFNKVHPQQAFCRTNGTLCKDKFWNEVDPYKKNRALNRPKGFAVVDIDPFPN